MTGAICFLLGRTLKNRVLSRIRKLRSPKYLISALAGTAYLAFLLLYAQVSWLAAGNARGPDPDTVAAAEIAFGALLMLGAIYYWFFPMGRAGLFSEPEIQLLFPAPLSRISLINYRIARAQPAILFGVLITFVVFGRTGIVPRPVFLPVSLWIVYSFISLFRIAAWLTRRTVAGPAVSRIILVFLVAVATATVVRAYLFVPPLPAGFDVGILLSRAMMILNSGPVSWMAYPFRMLVSPAFSAGLPSFFLNLGPALLITAVTYCWVLGCSKGLDSAVGEPRESRGRGVSKPRIKSRRAQPFQLRPGRAPLVALYWKNLLLSGRISFSRAVTMMVIASAVLITVSVVSPEGVGAMIGSMAIAMAGFLTLLGPILFREDLRTDMNYIDLLKTYPIPGWGIVLGEVLAPATILAALQSTLVVIAAAVLPNLDGIHYSVGQRVCAAAAAILIMPALTLIGVLVQNAAVLLLPGWIFLGKEHPQGIEATGQRLISSIATALSLVVAAIPAGIVFGLIYVPGFGLVGYAALPAAAFGAAAVLSGEAAAGVILLGRLFDRFESVQSV